MPERAGRDIHSGQRVLRVNAEKRAVSTVRVQLVLRQEAAAQVERGVERERSVALREDEAIPPVHRERRYKAMR